MPNKDEEFIDKLPEDAKAEARKLSPKQLMLVGRQVTALYNLSCVDCKTKMRLDPQHFKNYNDFCDKCKQDKRIINCFKRLEKIHNDNN